MGFRSSAIALTHPHTDHARGFDDLVSQHLAGPIGCSTAWWELDESDTADAERVLARGAAEGALAAISDRWEREPATRWELTSGSTQQLGDATIHVLYPDAPALERAKARDVNPNELSSPMKLVWEEVVLLLGADLPRAQWATVGGDADLSFNALKVPHHGSKRSLHKCFASLGRGKLWGLAPWTRQQGPPRFADGGDVQAILTWVDEVHFTCVPRQLTVDLRPGDRVRRSEVAALTERLALPGGIVAEQLPDRVGDEEAWVCFEFEADGAARVFHGGRATVVIE